MKTYLVNRLARPNRVVATVGIFPDRETAHDLCSRLNSVADGLARGEDRAAEFARLDPEFVPGVTSVTALRSALAELAAYECEEADMGECGCGGG